MSEESTNYAMSREVEVLTPTALNRLVRALIEDALPLIWVEGEISNLSRPSSGHIYFTLKDSQAQVRCALFKQRSMYLKFKPSDGTHVLLRARVSLYEGRGEFQLIVEHMEEAGAGALRREFERLKAKLAAEGLFAAERKRTLPALPRRIGIITSATGAAVRDVLSVIARRFPLVEVEVLPVPVQGKEAPPAIVAMLRAASHAQRHDVLLLTRGGGSLEDLWAFNDESVARAIVASSIPVVSAIGHEVDFTIADFVADLRAPTPSAAAELLVPDGAQVLRSLEAMRIALARYQRREQESLSQRLDHLYSRLQTQRPQTRLAGGRERLASLHIALRRSLRATVAGHSRLLVQLRARMSAQHPRRMLPIARARLLGARNALHSAIAHRLQTPAHDLAKLGRALNAVSPLATLQRGYSILIDVDSGQVIRQVGQINAHTPIRARLSDGEVPLRYDG